MFAEGIGIAIFTVSSHTICCIFHVRPEPGARGYATGNRVSAVCDGAAGNKKGQANCLTSVGS